MKTSLGPKSPINLVAGGALVSGQALLVGGIFGVVGNSAATGETYALWTEGIFTLPKLTTDVVTVGQKLYWDAGNSRLTTTVGTNLLVGCAAKAASGSVATVACWLPGQVG